MTPTEYYEECISEAAEECGAALTSDQVKAIAEAVEGAAAGISQAFGWDIASANRSAEIEKERRAGWDAVQKEREKITCQTCRGSGELREAVGSSHVSISSCWKCGGQGRHAA